MDKQFMEMLSGDSLSQARIIMEKLLSMPNCFVGWVQSYNSDKKTVTILPAIKQSAKTVEQAVETYTNRPLYVDVWVLSNALGRPPQIGDKAVCFVLDQKSNAFFKTAYNGSQSLTQQTFVPSNNNYRSQNDLCAIIVGEGASLYLHEVTNSSGSNFRIKSTSGTAITTAKPNYEKWLSVEYSYLSVWRQGLLHHTTNGSTLLFYNNTSFTQVDILNVSMISIVSDTVTQL